MSRPQWVLREATYPHLEYDALQPNKEPEIRTVRQIEAIWKHPIDPSQPLFPSMEDVQGIIVESRERWGRPPNVVVVSPPRGTTLFGVEIV